MLNVFGFEVIGAVEQLLMLDLSCQPDCSCKFKYMPLAVHFSGTPGLLELIIKVGLSAVRKASRFRNGLFQCSWLRLLVQRFELCLVIAS